MSEQTAEMQPLLGRSLQSVWESEVHDVLQVKTMRGGEGCKIYKPGGHNRATNAICKNPEKVDW